MRKSFTLLSLTFIALCYTSLSVRAQDVQYSQFYANPLYLNPAMTGGLEWNLKATQTDLPNILRAFEGEFGTYWNVNQQLQY